MVTAEVATALPALVVLLACGLTVVAVIGGQLRCVDAAREATRALARDEPMSAVRSLALQAAPRGAVVVTGTTGDRVQVAVRAHIRPFGHVLPTFTVRADATALHEPTSVGQP